MNILSEPVRVYIRAKSKNAKTRICKNRNILKQYLSSKEVEVVTIMMTLFNDEQIMRTYAKDIEKETERKTAERMIRNGETLEKIACYIPSLSMDELKELEAEVMQLI